MELMANYIVRGSNDFDVESKCFTYHDLCVCILASSYS